MTSCVIVAFYCACSVTTENTDLFCFYSSTDERIGEALIKEWVSFYASIVALSQSLCSLTTCHKVLSDVLQQMFFGSLSCWSTVKNDYDFWVTLLFLVTKESSKIMSFIIKTLDRIIQSLDIFKHIYSCGSSCEDIVLIITLNNTFEPNPVQVLIWIKFHFHLTGTAIIFSP